MAPSPSEFVKELRAALRNGPFLVAWCALGLVVLGVSYLDEDAFISFRVVENFVHGYGLRWNVDERVQVYTHPLWVILLVPLRALFGRIDAASYVLSWLLSMAAFSVVAWDVRARSKILLGALLVPLLCSQAFTDYTSSGLENPLTYFLLALLVRLGFEERLRPGPITLVAALSILSRPDAILLALPLCVRALGSASWRERVRSLGCAALPLAAWFGFSLFYYGVLFPNPKYAKLGGSVDQLRYLELGFGYLLDSLRNDTVTAVAIVVGGGASVVAVLRSFVARLRGPREGAPDVAASPWLSAAWLGAGAGLYTVYVVAVGGDFMAGRHFAAPFFLLVAAASFAATREPLEKEARSVGTIVVAALVLHFAVQPLTAQRDVIFPRDQKRTAVVRAGEIRLQRYNCGFYEALWGARGPASEHSWSQKGIADARKATEAKGGAKKRFVVVDGAAGKTPFFAGPSVTYVDPLGIADALLARLPDADGKVRIVGHLQRSIPEGYVWARATDDTQKMEPHLARYYERLRVLTSAPLLAPGRLRAIVEWNWGTSDAELEAYVAESAKKRRTKPKSKRSDSSAAAPSVEPKAVEAVEPAVVEPTQ